MSTVAVISIGSNADDRTFRVQQTIEWLLSTLSNAAVSSVYETQALNKPEGRPYTNAVLKGETDMSLDELNDMLKKREKDSGRDIITRAEGIVTIDLDIVMWDGRIIRNEDFERPYFNQGYRELLVSGAFEE